MEIGNEQLIQRPQRTLTPQFGHPSFKGPVHPLKIFCLLIVTMLFIPYV